MDPDDTLILLFMCCHPALTASSAIALTLRAVGGLTTAEIANAFLVPEATMAQRISRAKQTIKASGVPFRLPSPHERAERLPAVLHVLYLIFSEGYASSIGAHLQRLDLAREAIRLTRNMKMLLPEDPEVAGLLALMLLTDARRAARTGPEEELIPLTNKIELCGIARRFPKALSFSLPRYRKGQWVCISFRRRLLQFMTKAARRGHGLATDPGFVRVPETSRLPVPW